MKTGVYVAALGCLATLVCRVTTARTQEVPDEVVTGEADEATVWDEGHDVLFFGEEAWLEAPGEFGIISRVSGRLPGRSNPLDSRVPGGRADVERFQLEAGLELEAGLAPGWEMGLELAGQWLRDREPEAGTSGDYLALTEIEAGVRYSPWWSPTGIWSVGLVALIPTGSASAGVTAGDGAGGGLHSSLSLEPGSFALHAGFLAGVRLPSSRPADVQGEDAVAPDGSRFDEVMWYEVEFYGAVAFHRVGRRLWFQLEYQGELEPEVEEQDIEVGLEHRVGLGTAWIFLVEDGAEVEPIKLGLMGYAAFEGDEVEPGVQVQLQFEVE